MACLKSSVVLGRTNIPAALDPVSTAGVAKLAPPPQRCSIFYRWAGFLEDFLRLSPYGSLMFAAPAAAHGLSRPRELRMLRNRVVRDATPCDHAIPAALSRDQQKEKFMQIVWTNDLRKLFEWCASRILSTSAEYLAELSGVVALTQRRA